MSHTAKTVDPCPNIIQISKVEVYFRLLISQRKFVIPNIYFEIPVV